MPVVDYVWLWSPTWHHHMRKPLWALFLPYSRALSFLPTQQRLLWPLWLLAIRKQTDYWVDEFIPARQEVSSWDCQAGSHHLVSYSRPVPEWKHPIWTDWLSIKPKTLSCQRLARLGVGFSGLCCFTDTLFLSLCSQCCSLIFSFLSTVAVFFQLMLFEVQQTADFFIFYFFLQLMLFEVQQI